ncbi:MAG: PEP/pyruvate-binding domain-containing protein [Candidatus Margulisiibacteriota bacterium]
MSLSEEIVSTGLKGLDAVLQHLRLGDNVVWQVQDIAEYIHFIKPFVCQAKIDQRKIIYIRFAQHVPLLVPDQQIKQYELDAASGFESFSKKIHDIITTEGFGAFYVFDCLSDLLSVWATDLMIGNFFMVTCPYLFKLDTVAYFALLRDNHSYKTIARIRETTQLLLDVYRFEGRYYVHPLKVWNRYSPLMFLPHLEDKEKFLPVTSSADAAQLLSFISLKGSESGRRNLDYWDRLFLEAKEVLAEGSIEKQKKMLDLVCKTMLGREERILALVEQNMVLLDLINIKERMVGTGYIGGKAVGMLLARKILQNNSTEKWNDLLEAHDSFYIGSDVFYTYIVQNGWWDLWLEQKTEKGYFEKAAELRELLLHGRFPDEIKERFRQLIEYFGQSPIIVRSSSLLEDSFGSAFAGKYDSLFIVNQGSPEERYKQFEMVVREIFASTMNENALIYRQQRGLSQLDEQMALLVQRVSGDYYGRYFFPFLAGVGVSHNTFVWDKGMDPKAGMLRLVFGLGTRAVNRVEGDYPAIVALDAPLRRPYADMEKVKRFSQHEVDLLDIKENRIVSIALEQLMLDEPNLAFDLVGIRDTDAETKMLLLGSSAKAWVITFEKLLSKTRFSSIMQKMLKIIEAEYQYPVDIEFTVNFSKEGQMQINLVQCRPLQSLGIGGRVKFPLKIAPDKILFKSQGNFMGGNLSQPIKKIIYVDSEAYRELLMGKKYEVAREIGRINRLLQRETEPTLLIGPGRWGTRDPSLGVPVSFAEINNIAALVEVDDPEGGFSPELSFGSHFFLDLVETRIFYVALFLESPTVLLDKKWLKSLPGDSVIKIVDLEKPFLLLADITSQKVLCEKST